MLTIRELFQDRNFKFVLRVTIILTVAASVIFFGYCAGQKEATPAAEVELDTIEAEPVPDSIDPDSVAG